MKTIESIKKDVERRIKNAKEIYSGNYERLDNISHTEQNIDEYIRGLIAQKSIELVENIAKYGKYSFEKETIQSLLKEKRIGIDLGIESDDQLLDVIENTRYSGSGSYETVDITKDRIAQAIYQSFGYTDRLVSERELKTAEENYTQSYNPETLYALKMAQHSRGIDIRGNNVSESFHTAEDYHQQLQQNLEEKAKKDAEKKQFSKMYEQAQRENEEFDRQKEEERKRAEKQAALEKYKALNEEYNKKSIFGKLFAKLTGKTSELEAAKEEYWKYANSDPRDFNVSNEGRSR